MDNNKIVLTLFVVGIIGHLILRKSMDIGIAFRSIMFNQFGEVDAGKVTFTPEQQAVVDGLIDRRIGEVKAKYEPLVKEREDLMKFKTDFEKSKEQQTLADQEKAKEYDAAKKGFETKINELSTKLTEKDRMIQDRDISHSLTTEIGKQGGFTEEVLAMIRGNAVVDEKGNVLIKSRDANGVESNVSVADGVKKFLTERPHLVKSTFKPGGGSGSGDNNPAGGGAEESLEVLNAKLADAMRGTDLKLRSELKQKVKAALEKKRGVKTS